jgi:hypothetical protein
MNDIKNCIISNGVDEKGNPTGGAVNGTGLAIAWQNGPLGRGLDRVGPNGAFVETVISAALQRIQFYQASQYACEENARAATHLQEALFWLDHRTRDREERQVEGLHIV